MKKNYYIFLETFFSFSPFMVFRVLQANYKIVFSLEDEEEVIKLYESYI